MTRSTGKRAAQRRREALFGAELKLLGVERHLLDWYAMATYYRADEDAKGYMAAVRTVAIALKQVQAEQRGLL